MTNGWVWPIWQRQSHAPSIDRSGKAEAMTVSPFGVGGGEPAGHPGVVAEQGAPVLVAAHVVDVADGGLSDAGAGRGRASGRAADAGQSRAATAAMKSAGVNVAGPVDRFQVPVWHSSTPGRCDSGGVDVTCIDVTRR
jgi:hypothetical protein